MPGSARLICYILRADINKEGAVRHLLATSMKDNFVASLFLKQK